MLRDIGVGEALLESIEFSHLVELSPGLGSVGVEAVHDDIGDERELGKRGCSHGDRVVIVGRGSGSRCRGGGSSSR